MLPKFVRVNLKRDFKWVASGQKMENGNLKLFLKLGENIKPKVGISLSKAVFKKAVERNRAKRLMAEAFQRLYLKLPVNSNIVALPKKSLVALKSDELQSILEDLLRRNRIINA